MDQLDSRYPANVLSAIAKTREILGGPYKQILVSISGGADSDIMLDMLELVGRRPDQNIVYAFYNTGIEYAATLQHLDELESKYNITIVRTPAQTPVPKAVATYGQPFLNKQFSNYIARLQKHNFTWEDAPFDYLYSKYPKCKAALRWWCNNWPEGSRANIKYYRQLKEYMTYNPPTFRISDKCCDATKKRTAASIVKQIAPDLCCIGVRRAEGGPRATAYHSCFSSNFGAADMFRPLFWITNNEKHKYCKLRGIIHSKCYTEYGLDRTGCAGCPFGKNYEKELAVLQEHEPKLYTLATAIFKDSYEYTRKYYQWRNEHK